MSDFIGRTLGPYQITGEIGHGGMANVYRAIQPSIGRDVAVKVLPTNFLQDRTFLERFNREVQVIARLKHPRILPVYDFGEQDGLPYIVMAYMEGGTLSDQIKRSNGGLSMDATARIVNQVAEGLDYAHRKGIIHRDFKPSNVLLDEDGNVHLADFGIAKVTGDTAQLTGSGVIGTPQYMAPEMTRPGGVSALIDVYALGVTIYQMLTGQLPYRADTPMGAMLAHATEPIPDIRSERSDASEVMQVVLSRGMAKDPMERYQSAGEMARDFQAAVDSLVDKFSAETNPSPGPVALPTQMPIVASIATQEHLPSTPAVVETASTVETLRDAPSPPRRPTPRAISTRVRLGIILGGLALVGLAVLLVVVFGAAGTAPTSVVAPSSRDYSKITSITNQQGGDTSPIYTRDQNLLIFSARRQTQNYHLYAMGLNGAVKGSVKQVTTRQGDDIQPVFSPDGNLLIFSSNRDGRYHLYSMLWTGQESEVSSITSGNYDDLSPAFSPDGNLLIFSSNREGRFHLYSFLWTGQKQKGEVSRITSGSYDDLFPTFSPDGNLLIFSSNREGSRFHLYSFIWRDAQKGIVTRITSGDSNNIQPAFSPDSRTLAFASDRGGNYDIWQIAWGSTDMTASQVTHDSRQELYPRFSPDSNILVFSAGPSVELPEPFFFLTGGDLYSAGPNG